MSRCFVPVCLLAALLLTTAIAWAWDGNWTQGRSGSWPAPDSGDKQGDAGGTEARPQQYYIPPNPQFDEVDPEEASDTRRKKNYSPYALVRLTREIMVHGKPLPVGYYLVKPGHFGDGSPQTQALPPLQTNPDTGQFVTVSTSPSQLRQDSKGKPFQVFVLKQLGKVIAVIPIQSSQPYVKDKKQKLPKQPLAWVDIEGGPSAGQPFERALLKFYYKKTIYISDLGQL